MNDTTALLRLAAQLPCDPRHRETLTQAADEIDRLRAENEQLKQERGEPVAWWDGSTTWNPDSFTFGQTPFNSIPLCLCTATPEAVPDDSEGGE